MMTLVRSPQTLRANLVLLSWALGGLLVVPAAAVNAQPAPVDVLRIGSTGSLGSLDPEKEKGALETLKDFIKSETGFDNVIDRFPDWREVADKLAQKQLHLGVFAGYEFAWAQEKQPKLKPLAVAVNVYRYPTAHVVTKKDDPATDFAGLRGHSLAVPSASPSFVRLFVERQCQANGKKPEEFFAKITNPENVEDALDDAVDGAVQAVAVDRAALEAFKKRKPARFNRLKEVAKSQPFPPPVVVYFEGVLDKATLQRFRDGLLNASRKEKGQTLLTLFRLTGFEPVPDDVDRVLAETRKAYPPDKDGK
jgi:ABC-type phosphate/phosphonate transport system substrate-binding protein